MDRFVPIDSYTEAVGIFFGEIAARVSAPAHKIDVALGQADYWHPPAAADITADPENGLLSFQAETGSEWNGLSTSFMHSFWLQGEAARHGIFFREPDFGTALLEWDMTNGEPETSQVWLPKAQSPKVIARGGMFAIEWVFDISGRDISREPALRAFFSHGLRHAHARMLDLVDLFVSKTS